MGVLGTIAGIVIGGFILYLVLSAVYFTIEGLSTQNSHLDSGNTSTSTSSGLTSATSIGTNLDNMSLAQLETLSFANSTSCGSLFDAQNWGTALKSSGNTTLHLIPNTVYGLMQSANEWTSFFRQNMTDPPSWLSLGLNNYTSELETQLAASVMGTNDLTLAAAVMKNYTSLAGGLTLAGVDLVSFGGLSGLKTYVATGSGAQAASATFPGQIYQLYVLSQDCGYPKLQRAQFFGEALALTSIVVATSGKDGFGPKFEALLSKAKLFDAWPRIKSYLKDISSTSPAVAYETTVVLEELAKKFPATFGDVGPFTSDRIDLMIQALKNKGLSPDVIKEKVAELAQVADGATGDGDVAEAADEISYRETGTILARVDDKLQLNLHGGALPSAISRRPSSKRRFLASSHLTGLHSRSSSTREMRRW